MKAILPYVLLMTGTLVASLAIVGGLYFFRPQLFGVVQKPPAAARKDSSGVRLPLALADSSRKADSTRTGGADSLKPPLADASRLSDSIRTLQARLAEQEKTIAGLTEKTARAQKSDSSAKPVLSDSARAKESKSFAKMLEAMPAEQAVRILKGLDDREVKAVLLTVKKRQAAKILSALDPDRAARMMREMQ